jgi:hypothetical protein
MELVRIHCRPLDMEFLLKVLMDIKDVQRGLNEFIDSSVYEAKNVLIFDSEACDVETNLTKINELSTCPWHTRIEIRENRYPMMMSQVKCNCQKF